jgi:hypothetical protein
VLVIRGGRQKAGGLGLVDDGLVVDLAGRRGILFNQNIKPKGTS